MKMRGIIAALVVMCGVSFMAPATEARVGFGARGGFTSSDSFDQFFVGAHATMSGVIPSIEKAVFEPSLEFGFGDSATTIRVNGNFKYNMAMGDSSPLTVYPLAGLAFYRYSFDCEISGVDCSVDGNEIGLNVGGGFKYDRFGADVTLGVGDIPDLTITGYFNLR